MAKEPYNLNGPIDEDDYRRRAEEKAKRRKKRQLQRLIVLGAFGVAAILVIVVIVMLFRSIFGKDNKKPVSSMPPSSISAASSVPQLSHPIAPDPALWSLQLVNAQTALPEDFKMVDDQLASVVNGSVAYWFDARIADSLKQLIADCNANVEGGSLEVVSGYRSPSNQNERYQHLVEVLVGQGKSQQEADIIARQIDPPSGLSEHQLGLAADFSTATLGRDVTNLFADTPEAQWLRDNAANYGFILRYPAEKEAITGTTYQPYHYRFIGTEEAKAVVGAGICLEEYLLATPEAPAEGNASSEPPISTSVDLSGEGSAPTD